MILMILITIMMMMMMMMIIIIMMMMMMMMMMMAPNRVHTVWLETIEGRERERRGRANQFVLGKVFLSPNEDE